MNVIFYLSAAVAVVSTLFVITQLNAMHALLYLVVSLLAVAMMFFTLGAPFVGMLEIIIYAGAIIVLFLFAIMLLNLGPASVAQESRWLSPRIWTVPSILGAILFAELIYVLTTSTTARGANYIGPAQVGVALYSQYMLGVEMASFLVLSGIIGAYHLGRRDVQRRESAENTQAGEQIVKRPPVQARLGAEETAEQQPRPVFQPDYTGTNQEPVRQSEGREDEWRRSQ